MVLGLHEYIINGVEAVIKVVFVDDEPVLEGNISVPGTVGAPDGSGI